LHCGRPARELVREFEDNAADVRRGGRYTPQGVAAVLGDAALRTLNELARIKDKTAWSRLSEAGHADTGEGKW
jgi:hypothetical protein